MDTQRHSRGSMWSSERREGRALDIESFVRDREYSGWIGSNRSNSTVLDELRYLRGAQYARPPEPPRDKWWCHLAEHLSSLCTTTIVAWSQSFHEYRGWFARRLAAAFSRCATGSSVVSRSGVRPRVFDHLSRLNSSVVLLVDLSDNRERCNRGLTSHG